MSIDLKRTARYKLSSRKLKVLEAKFETGKKEEKKNKDEFAMNARKRDEYVAYKNIFFPCEGIQRQKHVQDKNL